MDAYDKQFTDRALSDLTRIYRDEEDPIGEEESPRGLSNSIFHNANLAFNPSIIPVNRRYVALEAASKLLVYAAKLHKEIKAETGEFLGENEQVSAEEDTENYCLYCRLIIGGPAFEILKGVTKQEAKDAGEIYATTGAWMEFKNQTKWIGPNDIDSIYIEKMPDGES